MSSSTKKMDLKLLGEVKGPKSKTRSKNTMDEKSVQEQPTNIYFLSNGNQLPKEMIHKLGNYTLGKELQARLELEKDIKTLTATELRKKFFRTYKCWDNMMQRAKKGYIIHKDFATFKDFLLHVGPCEDKRYTLDRLDNDDPEYAPGKVQWRDKYAQNSNKGNNVYLTHDDGRTRTVAQWAKITGQKPGTLYKRKGNGWTDMEVLTGKRDSSATAQPDSPFPLDKRANWDELYLGSIHKGNDHSEMEFLQKQSHARIQRCEIEGGELSEQIEHFEDYDPENDELPALKAKLKEVSDYYLRMNAIYRESTEQLEYDLKKEHFKGTISKRPNGIRKILLNKFEKTNPRPKYTVNTPQFKYSMS